MFSDLTLWHPFTMELSNVLSVLNRVVRVHFERLVKLAEDKNPVCYMVIIILI